MAPYLCFPCCLSPSPPLSFFILTYLDLLRRSTCIYLHVYIYHDHYFFSPDMSRHIVQGPNYGWAKRLQQWRAILARQVCNALQHTATHCNTLQHIATHCNTPQHIAIQQWRAILARQVCNTLQHTATHCNTLQHTATHCNTLQHIAAHYNSLCHTATHCNTLQHTATHCGKLQTRDLVWRLYRR